MKINRTKLFFVVDSLVDNEEIFETLEEAEEFFYSLLLNEEKKPRLYIAMVRNYFWNSDDGWNYSDQSDTFVLIKILKQDFKRGKEKKCQR